jgi:hypothetical protein
MSRKALVPLFAAVLLAVPAIESAVAVTNLNSSRSNIARNKHVTGTRQPGTTRATTVKSSKSNSSDRMGGGGGGGATARSTTVKSSKSNTGDRMGGGGGGLFLNPQPEPPGRARTR